MSKKKTSILTEDWQTKVVSYRHPEQKRKNIPEVGLVTPESDPVSPKTTWAYDPHIDPALQFDSTRSKVEKVIDDALASGDAETMREALATLKRMQEPYLNWTGKAERTSFEIDTVSLHVHERIDPASILSALQKQVRGAKNLQDLTQMGLFSAPFEELPLRDAISFYKHDRGWSNRLIAGDSLLVMNSLLQKESMAGQVQMIYIDPPYGIRYGSNFQPFVNQREVSPADKDSDLSSEPEMIRAFRDTWELGIHSYLTYLRDRLLLARDLMHDSGSIFVQISETNEHLIRCMLDEIFGKEQFVSMITFVKTSSQRSTDLHRVCDYLLWYCKSRSIRHYQQIFRGRQDSDSEQSSVASTDLTSINPGYKYEIQYHGSNYKLGRRYWTIDREKIQRLERQSRLIAASNTLRYERRSIDFPAMPLSNVWTDTTVSGAEGKVYVVQTSSKVIERCLLLSTKPGDIVLDITCGAGTTATAAEKWGRRWITCDTSRVAITLAKQRLMTASFDYYELRYPNEGLKGGFIYDTVPHVTLKSIANNPEIDVIYDDMHPKIESALAELNAMLQKHAKNLNFTVTEGVRKKKTIVLGPKESLFEWEVPFNLPTDWPALCKAPFEQFHAARIVMQKKMDASIAAHADQEVLYDKPKVSKNKLRITGPFTVEAVPFPSVINIDDAEPPSEPDVSVARSGETSRQNRWRDELLKTGVRGKGGQKIEFSSMETLPDLRYIHAIATMKDTADRVLVSFGPDHAALEQRQVELAIHECGMIKPAAKFILFCAFTFDPEAAKDIDEMRYPGVTLLKAQMNTDLLTEDLKKAGKSNQSFWLMGQPDVELRQRSDGTYEVEVHGFDYFDVATGELKSGGKKNIAVWMLDTDYDNRSLFPRQVFFPMAGEKDGWNRLKKTIRAELDESRIDAFHGTVSLPFEKGEFGTIAVKIVDDRGIESLKIMKVG
ncbi:MAG: site-specific DNA-methyltransferase [Ignavibacteria bacterium]|nr:site-specific DNA-methyltransferase [Ignavibacteria bacterium]